MKKIIFTVALATLVGNANYTIKQIENMVVKIHNKRPGLDPSVLEHTTEPFAIDMTTISDTKEQNTKLAVNSTVKEKKVELHAIFGNKAYINNKWFKVDDTINGYQLRYIGKRGIVLQSGNIIKKVFFNNKKSNLIKLEGR